MTVRVSTVGDMPWFRRSAQPPPLPAQVRAGLGLGRAERLLTHAMLVDGSWIVATSAALVLVAPVTGPDAGPGTPHARYLWHDVAEATWDPDTRTIEVHWVSPTRRPLQLVLDDHDTYLPEVLRERVMSTYVLSERVAVRGRRGVTVAIRRHAVDGSLFSQAVPDAGIDLDRPQVADQVATLTRDLSAQVGLAP